CTGELADAQLLERPGGAPPATVELECPAGELEPERRRLGVHAVRAADRERRAVLVGAPDDGLEGMVDAGEEQRARLPDPYRERGIDHVRRREPVMEPASTLLVEPFAHGVDEGGQVVVRA